MCGTKHSDCGIFDAHAAVRVKMQMDKAELKGPKAYDEQIELKIPVYDRGMQGQADVDNNYWTNYVQRISVTSTISK